MAKYRCCRFHRIFVILLALAVLSLVAHPLADALTASAETSPAKKAQLSLGAQPNGAEACLAVGLHGGFMLNELTIFWYPPTLFTAGDNTGTFGLTWVPPTLVPPPIDL